MKKGSFKKVMLLVLSLVLMFSMVACNNSSGVADGEENTTPPETEEGTVGSEGKDNLRIAFLSPANQYDFFVYIGASAARAAEAAGVTIDQMDAARDMSKLSDLIDHCVANKYDAIVFASGDKSVVPAVKEANAAGIPVINYDFYVEGADYASVITSNNEEMGAAAANEMVADIEANHKDEEVSVIVLNYLQSESNQDRCAGFKDVISDMENVTILEHDPGPQQGVEEFTRLMEDLLVRYQKGEVQYVFASNGHAALAAYSSILNAGRNEIKVLGIDDEEGQLSALQADDGVYICTIGQDPYTMGELCFEAAMMAINGESMGDIIVPAKVVTRDNVKDYIAGLEDKKEALKPYMME